MRTTLVIATLLLSLGCAHRPVRVAATSPDQSYFNVKPGDRLRIVLPLTKSGNALPHFSDGQIQGTTITLSASDLLGFQIAHYEAVAGRQGRLQLRYSGAEETRDGKSSKRVEPLRLPFRLPEKPLYLRLVYLVRASSADHNMAIVGSRKVEILESFTTQLRTGAAACKDAKDLFCEWVPAGIAVRPES